MPIFRLHRHRHPMQRNGPAGRNSGGAFFRIPSTAGRRIRKHKPVSRPTDAQRSLTIPAWVFTFGKWLIGLVFSLVILDFTWRFYVSNKVSNIPEMQRSLDKIEESQAHAVADLHDHMTDHNAHPNLDRLSTQIENLDRTIQTRSVVVDKKLDSIDESMRRQWEAISEMRKRAGPQ